MHKTVDYGGTCPSCVKSSQRRPRKRAASFGRHWRHRRRLTCVSTTWRGARRRTRLCPKTPVELPADEALSKKEATQLTAYQAWWSSKLKDKVSITNLCEDVTRSRAVSIMAAVLLPTAVLPEPGAE
eukprot:1967029-Prymnesium_polylepis.1